MHIKVTQYANGKAAEVRAVYSWEEIARNKGGEWSDFLTLVCAPAGEAEIRAAVDAWNDTSPQVTAPEGVYPAVHLEAVPASI